MDSRSFNPIDYPVCLTDPLRLVGSTWIQHVPFAMFLVDVLRPNVIVELGTASGVSYCAFCQAVKQTAMNARCYAIDTWEGDPHAGFYGPDVLADLRGHHDPLYGAFSQLIQSTFDDALGQFHNNSIDLLHIDGFHTYESVKHDFSSWLPKVSHSGVVLLHDISVRTGDFGVWRLWDEIKQDYRHFEFSHGYGLGAVFVGPICYALESILDSSGAQTTAVRKFFFSLGLRLQHETHIANLESTIRDQSSTIANLQEAIRATTNEMGVT